MLPRKMISACAVATLAMVFSVQQGEHGPLVVYKLQMPKGAPKALNDPQPSGRSNQPSPASETRIIPAARAPLPGSAPASTPSSPAAPPRLSPLQPSILGTLVMPASRGTAATKFVPLAPLLLPAAETAYQSQRGQNQLGQSKPGLPPGVTMINEETGEALTLDDVQGALGWRQDTVEKLRSVPIAPRF
ncbi:hypothetical protein HBA54_07040 [Pelagibius litoralis]|uniref:Uncharacterized protein n=1 Tax=Pelagibius litoralis TaxID=374515 RepID=A0A967EWU0_9PROT|nr:hypothetical protein [Pelagibius litoralis]NIA68343.1 hypothetical protein [Pelagibius litoralis]